MQQFTKPTIGKQVEVVLDNSVQGGRVFYHRPETMTYVGTVLTPASHVSPDAFALTGSKTFPVRTISLGRVLKMRYLDGAELAKMDIIVEDVIERQVKGSKDNVYTVKKQNKLWSCTCPGFIYRKDCKHIHTVKEETQ